MQVAKFIFVSIVLRSFFCCIYFGQALGPQALLTVALGPAVALAEGVDTAERVVAESMVVTADRLVLVLAVDAALLHAVHVRQQGRCEQTKPSI